MYAYELWRKSSDKLDYSLITLGFAVMALSLQFSPAMGAAWPWALIISWVFYLLSVFCGGLRLVRNVTFSRVEYSHTKIKEFMKERIAMLLSDNPKMYDHLTGMPMTVTDIQKDLTIKGKELKDTDDLLKKAGKWMVELFRGQFWSLVIGLALNGVFIAKNFLDKGLN